jgi:predicted DNA binding protein
MSLVAELTLSLDAFPLSDSLVTTGVSRITLEPVVPTTTDPLPFVRAVGGDVATVVDSFRANGAVASVEVLAPSGPTALYRLEWTHEQTDRFRALFGALPVMLLRSVATPDEWLVEVCTATGEALQAFRERCRHLGAAPELRSVTDPTDDEGRQYGVTTKQREALVLAATAGYFEQPRETSFDELAARLGITRQAFAGRLRRGHQNLVDSTLRGLGPEE